MFWTEKFLAKRREEWLKAIYRAEYTMDGKTYAGTIVTKKVEGEKLLIDIISTQGQGVEKNTITEVRLYDDNNDLAGKAAENTVKLSNQGIFTALEITLKEVQG